MSDCVDNGCSPADRDRECNRNNQQRKISYGNDSENIVGSSKSGERNTKWKYSNRGLNTPSRRKEWTQEDEDKLQRDFNSYAALKESKRKRLKDDSTPHRFKVHHRDSSLCSSSSSASQDSPRRIRPQRKQVELESDPEVLARRQKQIDYGKNTMGYWQYRKVVPKEKRERYHPRTPPKYAKYSRRGWDNLVKMWRQKLHSWDQEIGEAYPETKNKNR